MTPFINKCINCKKSKDIVMYNKYICITCRKKWEDEFYGRVEKNTTKK